MSQKYRITRNTIYINSRFLYQIQATDDFFDVDGEEIRFGDLGGWIESESNLSQDGRSWIYQNSCALNNARVENDACLWGKSIIC